MDYPAFQQSIAALTWCMEQGYDVPALKLMYSMIDTAGWLTSTEEYATKDSFLTWVNAYLLPNGSLKCTAIDLYAARCALLHTTTFNAKLTDKNRATQIAYYSKITPEFEQILALVCDPAIEVCDPAIEVWNEQGDQLIPNQVPVCIPDLMQCFLKGLLQTFEGTATDPTRYPEWNTKLAKVMSPFTY